MKNTPVVSNKKYIVIEHGEYENLSKRVASRKQVARKLSLAEGKKLAYGLIDKYHK